MSVVIYVGPRKLTLPKLQDLDRNDVASAEIVIVMNRLATLARVVKNSHGVAEDAAIVYLVEDE